MPCDALLAGEPMARYGSCGEAHGVGFPNASQLEWIPLPGVTGYNVDLAGNVFTVESNGLACEAAGLHTTTWDIPNLPFLGELWKIEVTSVFPEGEGAMGGPGLVPAGC